MKVFILLALVASISAGLVDQWKSSDTRGRSGYIRNDAGMFGLDRWSSIDDEMTGSSVSGDICVVETDKVQTFDMKQLTLPQSDCEVVLIGDCNEQQQQPWQQNQQQNYQQQQYQQPEYLRQQYQQPEYLQQHQPWQQNQQRNYQQWQHQQQQQQPCQLSQQRIYQQEQQPLQRNQQQMYYQPQQQNQQFSQNMFSQGRYQQQLQGQQWDRQQQIRVTLKSNVQQQFDKPKVLKVTLEQTQVELKVPASSSYDQSPITVKINGQQISVRDQQEIPIRSQQQQQLLAILKCNVDECEIESRKLDLHIKITKDKVHVQLKDAKSKGLCGLCLPGSEISTRGTEDEGMQKSVKIFKKYKVHGQPQCQVLEGGFQGDLYNQQQQSPYDRQHQLYNQQNQYYDQQNQFYDQQNRRTPMRRDMMGRGMDRNEAQRGIEDLFQ